MKPVLPGLKLSEIPANSVQLVFAAEFVTWDPAELHQGRPLGICGANADTIVARNFLRQVVGGAAAHSDHGRHLVLRLKKVAEGNGNGYEIKDKKSLVQSGQSLSN